MSKEVWHTKDEHPVYSPDRADNRIICTSILLGWHLNAFIAYIGEDGKVLSYNSILQKKEVEWKTTSIQRWAYLVDVVPLYEMADEREKEWNEKAKDIQKRLKKSVDDLPF